MSSPATPPSSPPAAQKPAPVPAPAKPTEQPRLFHFAECSVCRHILPLATTTDKYFAILAKDPRKPTPIGEKCVRCGSDAWILARD